MHIQEDNPCCICCDPVSFMYNVTACASVPVLRDLRRPATLEERPNLPPDQPNHLWSFVTGSHCIVHFHRYICLTRSHCIVHFHSYICLTRPHCINTRHCPTYWRCGPSCLCQSISPMFQFTSAQSDCRLALNSPPILWVKLYESVDGAGCLTVSITTYVFILHYIDWANEHFWLQNFPSLLAKF
jgi:hypothetical protein